MVAILEPLSEPPEGQYLRRLINLAKVIGLLNVNSQTQLGIVAKEPISVRSRTRFNLDLRNLKKCIDLVRFTINSFRCEFMH
jgi:hypothetical protein